MERPVVAIITDFGHSEYLAAMKAAIWRECPDCRIVDVNHDVHHGAILQGAHLLVKAVRDVPDAIFLVVVDPTVGTDRRAVIVVADGVAIVGPDNGLLEPAVRDAKDVRVFDLPVDDDTASPVFHGRDVFAPAAARLARGEDPSTLGHQGSSLMALTAYGHDRFGYRVLTRVSHIDVFGNVQTPLPAATVQDLFDIPRDIHVWIADRSHKARLVRTYADLAPGDLGVLVSSSGHVEIAQRDGPAAVLLEARIGDEIALDAE